MSSSSHASTASSAVPVDLSQAVCDMLGVAAAPFVPRPADLVIADAKVLRAFSWRAPESWPLAGLFPDHDRERVYAVLRSAFDAEGAVSAQFAVRAADGETRWLNLVAQAMGEGESEDRVVLGVVQDITEWRTSSLANEAETQRWYEALVGANFGVWSWCVPTGQFWISPTLRDMLGYEIDQSFRALEIWRTHLHPEDRRATLTALSAHLQGERPRYRMEHRLRHADGTYHWFLARGSVVRDENGTPLRMVGVLTDITRRVETRAALEKNEARLRAVFDGSFDGIAILDSLRDDSHEIVDFRFVEFNDRLVEMMETTHERLRMGTTLEVFPECMENGSFGTFRRAVETQERQLREYQCAVTGEVRMYRQQVVPLGDGVAVTLSDITHLQERDEALRRTEQLIGQIAQSVPELLYVFDLVERRAVYRNRNLPKDLGYEPEHQDPMTLEDFRNLVVGEDQSKVDAHLREMLRARDNEAYVLDVRLRRADGSLEYLELKHSVFSRTVTGEPREILGSASFVTARKIGEEKVREQLSELRRAQVELQIRQGTLERLNERLANLARKDGLTEVYNHRAFQERLAEELSRARRQGNPLTILMCDVDNFKEFNDRFGHVAGDERLRYFAGVLQATTRPSDFVARYGGEEFAVILPDASAEQATIVGERVLRTLMRDESPLKISASIGVAELSEAHASGTELIADADRALYAAKKRGKNCVELAVARTALG